LNVIAGDSLVHRDEDRQAEIPLSGVRAEFRTALRAEIEATEGASGTTAPS
jgi:hypothetical protein